MQRKINSRSIKKTLKLLSEKDREFFQMVMKDVLDEESANRIQHFLDLCTKAVEAPEKFIDQSAHKNHITITIKALGKVFEDPLGQMIITGLIVAKKKAEPFLTQIFEKHPTPISYEQSYLKNLLSLKRIQSHSIKKYCTENITCHAELIRFSLEFKILFEYVHQEIPEFNELLKKTSNLMGTQNDTTTKL